MGSRIEVESAPGQGSTFRFTLRFALASEAAAGVAEEPVPRIDLSGRRVLVVEDNAVNRMLITSYLDEFGLSHEMVGTGAAALLNLASKRYDLVLMDATMPDLDGVEATKRIRALQSPAAKVPVVALVSARTGDRGAYLAAGMNAYVSKPIRGRELYRVLARFLAKDAGEESALRAG
jgi:CheY-like chemotaxis protein